MENENAVRIIADECGEIKNELIRVFNGVTVSVYFSEAENADVLSLAKKMMSSSYVDSDLFEKDKFTPSTCSN